VSFAGVAAIGFGVQIATLAALTSVAQVPPALATALAVETAILHNFAWHERWTWRDRAGGGAAAVTARLARFHAGPGLVSLVGNLAITVPLVEWTPVSVVAANTCAVLVLGVANYCIADRFVFEPPSRAGAGDMHVGRSEALPHMRHCGWKPRHRMSGRPPGCLVRRSEALPHLRLTMTEVRLMTRRHAGISSNSRN
jgi:putative flippase GtrA